MPVKRYGEQDLTEGSDAVEEYRAEQFKEIGFTEKEARQLANAKDGKGVPIRPKAIQEALDAGCSPRQAVRVFT